MVFEQIETWQAILGSEMPAIVRLVLYRGRAVKVTIEEIQQEKSKTGLAKWQKD